MRWLIDLFSSDQFLAHGYCLLWQPELVALHVGSDVLIAAAYYSIPISLAYFVRRRRDLQFRWMFVFFAIFIFACGTTHLFGVLTLWQPAYGVEGLVKFATAVVSVATAAAIWPLLPQALALPSPSQLAAVNADLQSAQRALARTNEQLEQRVRERTAELTRANNQLRAEIAERERAEAQSRMLMAELEHRVKNTLAVAQSLVQHTRASSGTIDEFAEAFGGRLRAMGKAQNLLVRGDWRGAELAELVAETVQPYLPREEALRAEGPAVQLQPAAASSLAMILHELATNAAKYGAWSREGGAVSLEWRREGGELRLVWRESGGPAAATPARRGFGTRMIEHNTAYELGGRASLDFRAEGLVCEIAFPLS
jgi:two-component sensor histidine kinase